MKLSKRILILPVLILTIFLATKVDFKKVLADCGLTSTGNIPIMDLGTGTYLGYEGGLYPNGLNTRPALYEAEGVAIAQTVEPLGTDGLPSSQGKIVMLALGMSNTKQEFQEFIKATGQLKSQNIVNKKVFQLNVAQGGVTVDEWADPNNSAWAFVDDKLTQRGLTPEQVQILWVKMAHNDAPVLGSFPTHAEIYKEELIDVLENIDVKYPNAKLVYISSRTRAYTDSVLAVSPEPYSYEEGFAVKWVLEDKINGLLPDTPWVSWGPYLWIDGLNQRSDGYIWECVDTEEDFVHPSDSGELKISDMLVEHFLNDSTTAPWFLD